MRLKLHLKCYREDKVAAAHDFHEAAGMPGIIGCIDGTLVKIVAPQEEEWSYINRKGVHSINVQVLI